MNALGRERDKTQAVLDKFFIAKKATFAEIDESFLDFLESLHQQAVTAGKMARATLTRWAYAYLGGSQKGDIVMGSAAVELLHRFILIHDDVVDRDAVRHGIDTLEAHFDAEQRKAGWSYPIELHGIGMAMIGGDLSHSYAHELVMNSGFDPEITERVLRGLVDCLTYTAAGWRLETILKQQSISEVTREQITQAMLLVSGHYSVLWPARIGMLYSGLEYGEWNEELETYGEKLGIAFQLQDDLLGLMGDSTTTGKPVGNDLREAKKTLPLYELYQRASNDEKHMIDTTLGKVPSKKTLEAIRSMMEHYNVIEDMRHEARMLSRQAVDSLENRTGNRGYENLAQLAFFLVDRDH